MSLKALLLGVVAVALSACAAFAPKFERPVLNVVGIQMRSSNLLQQNFLVTFKVQNPNDRALPVRGIHASLNIAGEAVASGVTDKAFVVPPFGESQFDMNFTANMAAALLKLATKHDQRSDVIDYEVTGAASLDLAFMHDLPFHQVGTFALGR